MRCFNLRISPLNSRSYVTSPGQFHTPIVQKLWQTRGKEALPTQMDIVPDLLTKKPADSRLSVDYDFSKDEVLRERYRNPWGSVRVGRLIEDLDALAGNISYLHCNPAQRQLFLVTASIDRIIIRQQPPLVDMTLSGAVSWVGRSSLELRMEIHSRDGKEQWLQANFTFVARDAEKQRAAPINKLEPVTDEEKRIFAETEQRHWQRKSQPQTEAQIKEFAPRIQNMLAKARLLVDMPALADRNAVLIRDTRLTNALICQPQHRNMHGRIFGGFLVRRAFELAFASAYIFGGMPPEFLEVDEVAFLRPVEIGSLVRFESHVLYTSMAMGRPLIHTRVLARVVSPEQKSTVICNTFHFTFSLKAPAGAPAPAVRDVLPVTEEEALEVAQLMQRNRQQYDTDRQGPSAPWWSHPH